MKPLAYDIKMLASIGVVIDSGYVVINLCLGNDIAAIVMTLMAIFWTVVIMVCDLHLREQT